MSLISAFSPMTKEKLEILRMAKEILFNEYVDKKAQLHNQWLADSDVAWRTRRMRLPYPVFPPYPDNEMIIARALQLERFLNSQPDTEEKPIAAKEPVKVEEVQPVEKVVEPVVEEAHKEEKPSSIVPAILEENQYFKKEDEPKELLSDKPSLLPNWFARK